MINRVQLLISQENFISVGELNEKGYAHKLRQCDFLLLFGTLSIIECVYKYTSIGNYNVTRIKIPILFRI